MWLVCFVVATAAPIVVEVREVAPAPRAHPWRPRAEVVHLGPAPPLAPLREGGPAPDAPATLALAPGGLQIGAEALPPGWRDLWLLDPRGTREAWWRIEATGEGVAVSRCDAGALPIAHGLPAPTPAVPCAALSRSPAPSPGSAWRVHLSLDDLTTEARVLRTVTGPGREGGTWAIGGSSAAAPELGRPLDLGVVVVRPRVAVAADASLKTWRIEGVLEGDVAVGAWAWRLVVEGRAAAEGTIALSGPGPFQLDVPLETAPGARVQLLAPEPAGPLRSGPVVRVAASIPLPARLPAVWLRTPFAGDELELAFSSAVPVEGLRLVVEAGVRTHEVVLDLPAGAGIVRVRVPPRRRLTVAAPPLMPRTPVAR